MKHKSLVFCTVLLSGGDGTVERFLDENSNAFNTSFKQSFVEACKQPENTHEKELICSCLADDIIRNHSPSELTDQTRIEIYLDETALPKCMGETEQRHNI